MHNKKTLIDLSAAKAKDFLLKEKRYVNLELPPYFTFQNLLDKVSKELDGKLLSDFDFKNKVRDYDNVNYKMLYNKDGKYAWRPFQIIHPAIYISLVNQITEKKNWKTIIDRFKYFRENEKIECHSIPVAPESAYKPDKKYQIGTWWEKIEQRSVALALEYRYMVETDISNCYDSIYTHAVAWAIHGRDEAKKNRNNQKLIGNIIDRHLQDMNSGQTNNGIPQGSTLMDFLAEMVLGYVDSSLTKEIENTKKNGQSEPSIGDYRILRYRDDYRIFSNNLFEAGQIVKYLSETLAKMGLKLNAQKTKGSDDVIKNSVKPDKRYWIAHKRIAGGKWKWLMQLHLLSAQFPNLGTLHTEMRKFLLVVKKKNQKKEDLKNIDALISLVVEIAYRNPRVFPQSAAILLCFLDQIKDKAEKKSIFSKANEKFKQTLNSSINQIWLHWVSSKIDREMDNKEKICEKVTKPDTVIWNTDWLKEGKLKQIIDSTPIVDDKKRKKSWKSPTPTEEETKMLGSSSAYYS